MEISSELAAQLERGAVGANRFIRDLDGGSQLLERGLRVFLCRDLSRSRLRAHDNAVLALVCFGMLDPRLNRDELKHQVFLSKVSNTQQIRQQITHHQVDLGIYVRDNLDERWIRLQMLDMLEVTGVAPELIR